ncbi:hypothetical protein PhCBS80983_g02380 [Powellomyces hirtus]|uniref:Uncharacterized protein n=1 Tax=Powellomyces hirtus TaxID=109895 RepID=A0A507E6R2_9FUNG|nr:hypothetical protein PhCBS80983_g02380 [Powellomyces hirtus]
MESGVQPSQEPERASAAHHVTAGESRHSVGGVQELLTYREKELRDIYAALEQRVGEKEVQCRSLEDRLNALQDDFIYNLALLEERDKELENYDTLTEGLTTDIHDREAKISELKWLLTEKSTELANFKMLLYTQEQQHHDTIRKCHKDKGVELQHLEDVLAARGEEFELVKSELQLQIQSAQQEMELQKSAFESELEQAKREREVAVRGVRQECKREVLEAEHRVACVEAELAAVKSARDGMETKLQHQVDANRVLDTKLRQLEWEVVDSNKATSTRIAELEEALQQSHQLSLAAQASFDHTREKLLLDSEETKKQLTHAQSLVEEQARHLTHQLAEAMQQLAAERTEAGRKLHAMQECVSEREAEVRTLRAALSGDQCGMETLRRQYESEIAQRDATIASHESYIAKLEHELDVRCTTLQSMQHDIGALVAKEQELQRVIAQQNLENERKMATLQRKKNGDQSDLVRALVAAKEAAEAQVKLLRTKLRAAPARTQPHHASPAWRPLSTPPYDRDPRRHRDDDGEEGGEEGGGGGGGGSDYDTLGNGENGEYRPRDYAGGAQEKNGAGRERQLEVESENARLTAIIQQMRHDMQVMHDAMNNTPQAHVHEHTPHHQPRATTDTYGFGAAAAAADDTGMASHLHTQILKLQTLLAQKQRIIDDLWSQQETLHRKIDESMRRGRPPRDAWNTTTGDGYHQHDTTTTTTTTHLRAQLAEAVEEMRGMQVERERLLDMSNALQAEVRYWVEKKEAGREVGTQTVTFFEGRAARYKSLGTTTPSAAPSSRHHPHPVKQSERATHSQRVAKERMGVRGVGATPAAPVDEEGGDALGKEDSARVKQPARHHRRVRNWNEKSGDEM